MILNDDNSIREFEEKPKNPRSNKASMGVYVFTWSKLRQYLIDDEADPNSSNDFGKNVIPKMHADGEKMFAYLFDGYWKDVGTIDSLWEANLDLLNPKVDLDLSDTSWKIYAKTPASPPHYISEKATVQNSMISEGSRVYGDVDYSILFNDVIIEEGAKVEYSIVMPGTVIKKGAVVQYSMVAENAVIEAGAIVGANPQDVENRDDWGVAVVGAGVTVHEGAFVAPKAMVDEDVVKEAE
jgi:glucose-1-phosphate adenylyltransferase